MWRRLSPNLFARFERTKMYVAREIFAGLLFAYFKASRNLRRPSAKVPNCMTAAASASVRCFESRCCDLSVFNLYKYPVLSALNLGYFLDTSPREPTTHEKQSPIQHIQPDDRRLWYSTQKLVSCVMFSSFRITGTDWLFILRRLLESHPYLEHFAWFYKMAAMG